MALAAAILFGAAAPAAKLLLATMAPQLVAGILYLGAGFGLSAIHFGRAALAIPAAEAPLRRADLPWLGAAILFGGIIGPLLLMLGLARTDAASGALLLNLEGLATMAIAWVVFRENVDRRLLWGALAILAGGVTLSWNGREMAIGPGALLIAGACLAWGIDKNLTRKLSSANPVRIALIKGLVAGGVNTAIALAGGARLPGPAILLAALALGLVAVGLSLVMFVLALRHLGSARTGAYFSLSPFIGTAIAVFLLGDPVTPTLLLAGGLMALGLWAHLAERHEHEHAHEPLEHEHAHRHDRHHRHNHEGQASEPHSHSHRHLPTRHSHAHYPDLHHRHSHD